MKKERTLFLWLFQSYLLIIIVSLISLSLIMLMFSKQEYIQQIENGLEIEARLFEKILPASLTIQSAAVINARCVEISGETNTRFTVILPDGSVIGDSEEDYSRMENHGDRPEVITALAGKVGKSTRYSYSRKQDMMYVALPLMKDGRVAAVVRSSMPVAFVSSTLRSIYAHGVLTLALVVAAAVLASFIITHGIGRPLRTITEGANRFASGDLSHHIFMSSASEFNILSTAMNTMAVQLNGHIKALTEQRNELDAILSGMVEAVFSVDKDRRITEFNHAAGELFHLSQARPDGKRIQEILRNIKLSSFVEQALSAGTFIESEIRFYDNSERVFQAHATPIFTAAGERNGAVIVLHDITELKKLETIRRDFVANVSHELKTPITSIIGYVETLRDGAMDDPGNRDRFLDIIMKHSERLNGIIDDLLSLSRVERGTEGGSITFEQAGLAGILENAVSLCKNAAAEKSIQVTLDAEPATVAVNPSMLEQAVMNLVDNAIKYNSSGGTVTVQGRRVGSDLVISVADTGIGIPEDQQERIFERFYRIDKGRSRETGGTGLGLAIVKHIALAHHGRVTVESAPGRGSVFTLTIPAGQ